jgi:hypothetical protein
MRDVRENRPFILPLERPFTKRAAAHLPPFGTFLFYSKTSFLAGFCALPFLLEWQQLRILRPGAPSPG